MCVCVCEANCITEPTVKRLIKAPPKNKIFFGTQIERRKTHEPQLFRVTTTLKLQDK